MRLRARQLEFSCGDRQTVPSQPASCHGTRTDRCRSGMRAPRSVFAIAWPLLVVPRQVQVRVRRARRAINMRVLRLRETYDLEKELHSSITRPLTRASFLRYNDCTLSKSRSFGVISSRLGILVKKVGDGVEASRSCREATMSSCGDEPRNCWKSRGCSKASPRSCRAT